MLPETSLIKYFKNVCVMVLESQLYGCARDFFCSILSDKIQSENSALHVVNGLQKRDCHSVLSTMKSGFNSLVNCRHGTSVLFESYETGFGSIFFKFIAHGDSLEMPKQITAFSLMASARITEIQRVSTLAATAKDLLVGKAKKSAESDARLSDASLGKSVTYETVASILRQFEP